MLTFLGRVTPSGCLYQSGKMIRPALSATVAVDGVVSHSIAHVVPLVRSKGPRPAGTIVSSRGLQVTLREEHLVAIAIDSELAADGTFRYRSPSDVIDVASFESFTAGEIDSIAIHSQGDPLYIYAPQYTYSKCRSA